MQLSARSTVGFVLLATALALPAPANACSPSPFFPWRFGGAVLFIGTATPDTVPAGPGSMHFTVAGERPGPAGARAIYGQTVSVERLLPADRARLPKGVAKVVLVPWANTTACETVPWDASARWITAGTRGLYTATLRARSHWIRGVPTLDVAAPGRTPYPTGPSGERNAGRSTDSILSADELFPALELLPDPKALHDSAEQAVQPLLRWARANPSLARRSPLAETVRFAVSEIESARVHRIAPPVRGTYRFTVSVAGTPDRVFFVRTELAPSGSWDVRRAPRDGDDPTLLPPLEGYLLLATAMPSLAALPHTCADRRMEHEAYMALTTAAPVRGADGDEWKGMIEFAFIERGLATDSAGVARDSTLAPYARAWTEEYERRYHAGLPERTPARFTMRLNEPMRVRTDVVLPDGRTLVLRGERISMDVSRCTSVR